jgi:ATP-dependent Clp protease ATP-binding subunit ClpA
MFERFTDRARRVLVLAQDEARELEHDFLGTEHLLLGMVTEGEGLAAVALTQLGVELDTIRAKVTSIVKPGAPGTASGAPPFTPRAKKVLELALKEALQLGHNYIGTEHLLLGLIREGEGVASQVLIALGMTPDKVRTKVIQLLAGYASTSPTWTASASPAGDRSTPAHRLLRTRAVAIAGPELVGTHHELLALLEDPDCLAGRILTSMGVTKEAVESRIQEMGTAGTTDEPPKPKVQERIELDSGVVLTVDDPAVAEQVRGWIAAGPSADEVLDRLAAWLRERGEGQAPSA